MAEQGLRLGAVVVVQPGDLPVAAGVHPIEDRIAQGVAVPVHRDAVTPQGGQAHTADLAGGHAALGQDPSGQPAEAAPPVLLRVVLEPARLRVHGLVRLAGKGHETAGLVDEGRLALVRPHIDA